MQLGPLSFLTSVFSVISVDNLAKKNYSDQLHPPPCTKRLVGKYSLLTDQIPLPSCRKRVVGKYSYLTAQIPLPSCRKRVVGEYS
jgi:hypothetical protein